MAIDIRRLRAKKPKRPKGEWRQCIAYRPDTGERCPSFHAATRTNLCREHRKSGFLRLMDAFNPVPFRSR
jgi:hypothetical protein